MTRSLNLPAKAHSSARFRPSANGNEDPLGIDLWAVHPGGRTVLDAVESAFALGPEALDVSRQVLSDYGNMSSATVMFVLQRLMAARQDRQGRGCAMAFGPGLVAETMRFHLAA